MKILITQSNQRMRPIDVFPLKITLPMLLFFSYGHYNLINETSFIDIGWGQITKLTLGSILTFGLFFLVLAQIFDKQRKDKEKAKTSIIEIKKYLDDSVKYIASQLKLALHNKDALIEISLPPINIEPYTHWNKAKETHALYGTITKNGTFLPTISEHIYHINNAINLINGYALIRKSEDPSTHQGKTVFDLVSILINVSALFFTFDYLDDVINKNKKSFFRADRKNRDTSVKLMAYYGEQWIDYLNKIFLSIGMNANNDKISLLIKERIKDPYYPYHPYISIYYSYKQTGRTINDVWFPNFFADQILSFLAKLQANSINSIQK